MHVEQALAASPGHAGLLALQQAVVAGLSEAFVKDGRCTEAVLAASRLIELGGWPHLARVASYVRRCVDEVAAGAESAPREREQAEQWAGRAVQLLRLALEHGTLRIEDLAPGTEWDSLDDYPAFRALRAELGQGQ